MRIDDRTSLPSVSASRIAVIGLQNSWLVFCVPGGDGSVGQGDVELGEQPRILRQTVALHHGDLRGNLVPVSRWCVGARAVGPETGDLSLLGSPCRARGAAQQLHFVHGVGIRLTLQRWRTRRTELSSAVIANGSDHPTGEAADTSYMGAVDCHTPGPLPDTSSTYASQPSPACSAITASPIAVPNWRPSVLAGPSGTSARALAKVVSSVAAWPG